MKSSKALKETFPFANEYLEKYGEQKLPPFTNLPMKFREQGADSFYKYLLENNLRWEDVVSGENYL